MIINIAFRNGTEARGTRDRAVQECSQIPHDIAGLTRIEIVFCQELHQANQQAYIQCHISMHAINKMQVDVYETMATESLAFDAAFDRAVACLQRKNLTLSRLKLPANELNLPAAL